MAMYSDKPGIQDLVALCKQKELKHIVISPGSRNAPLTITFTQDTYFDCVSVVDERSAGFIALGISQATNKPTVLLCTSGSAGINYGPALAEAFYQEVPLIAITADRPEEFVNQGMGQTIDQKNMFSNFVLKSISLKQEAKTVVDRHYNIRQISEVFALVNGAKKGPVHINVPLCEPLYNTTDKTNDFAKLIDVIQPTQSLDENQWNSLITNIENSPKVMFLVGLNQPNNKVNEVLNLLSENDNIVVLTETTSNLRSDNFIGTIDRVLSSFQDTEIKDFEPNLLISIGGPVVSKKVKHFLRNIERLEHWHISTSGQFIDSFGQLSKVIPISTLAFLNQLKGLKNSSAQYRQLWLNKKNTTKAIHKAFLNEITHSDFKVFDSIFSHLPEKIVLHISNSSPIRYAQLFEHEKAFDCYANRGTSGIDGCTSTAVGYAYASQKPTILITGDVAFLYDSNAFYNDLDKSNLKVVLINNEGGNIFRIIDGPSTSPALETYFETKHNTKAAGIAQAFGIDYKITGEENLSENIHWLFNESQGSAILEITTSGEKSAATIREYFNFLKEKTHAI